MKKIMFSLALIVLFLSCKGEQELESTPITKREVKVWINEMEEKNFPVILVTDDDGMIYINKENFEKLVKNLPHFEYIESVGEIVVFSYGNSRVEVDFDRKCLNGENISDKIGTNYERLKEYYASRLRDKDYEILKKYFDYEANKNEEKKEIKLKSIKGQEVLVYDIFTNIGADVTKDSKKIKTLYINNPTFRRIYMSIKTNEYSFEILKKQIEALVKLDVVDEDKVLYLEKNREKFIKNFYKEINEFSGILDRGHFGVELAGRGKQEIYAMKVGETKISDRGNSIIKIIDKDTAYLKISTFTPNRYDNKSVFLFEEFEKSMDTVKKYKNLIVDVRNNYGGHVVSAMYLVSLLTNEEVYQYNKGIRGNRKLVLADLSIEEYDGNLVVLVNRGSISGGTMFPTIIKSNNLGVVIGEKTGGQTDPIIKKTLPNGIIISSSSLKFDTDENYNSIDKGMIPDILIDDIATKKDKDPILTRALNYLKEIS